MVCCKNRVQIKNQWSTKLLQVQVLVEINRLINGLLILVSNISVQVKLRNSAAQHSLWYSPRLLTEARAECTVQMTCVVGIP